MAGINFIGSYSGIDKNTIDQLMQIERLPIKQLSGKKTDITVQQNAWKDVNTRLNSLFDKLKLIQSPNTFTSKTTKSSNDSIVSMTASKDAVSGKYDIAVGNLATSTRIIGANISGNINDVLNIDTGNNFKITNSDGKEAEIAITSEDSLKTIVNKINDETKITGINATIIDNKIVLSDEKTGARGITLSDTDTDTGISNGTLAKLGLNEGTSINGEKAEFTINGIPVKSDSNTVTDAVLGLTINLNKAHATGEYDTITVATDTEKLTKAVQDFVDQYNSTMSFIEEKLAAGTVGDGRTTGRGVLAGDSSLQGLHSSLRRMVTETLGGNSSTIMDISKLGVSTTDKSGKLSFNSSKLLEEFSKDSKNVMNFFSSKVGDEDVGFIAKLNTKIDSYISKSDGLIKSKNDSFDRTLKDLNRQIDRFNDRMVRKEAYYTKMFSALDVAMMQAESQMEWLNGQISAMNGQSRSK